MSESIKLSITGMSCNGRVEDADNILNTVEGVDFAVISQDDNQAVIIGNASALSLITALEAAGFEVKEI
ncbi:MAG: cation transporter [Gammaproteobacteria bacterium]|nr:cation transporter [Gammaproteobacteria bacterium]